MSTVSRTPGSTNHSRPYTFESRRGPHYYPNRMSSPTLNDGTELPSKTHSTASSNKSRSPPLNTDEMFQPPSLGEKSRANTHMYNMGAARAPSPPMPAPAYANPYRYNYNPAKENWKEDHGGFVDYSDPGYVDMVEFSRRRILARSRFILRLLATLSSVAVVASLGSAIAVFYDTRNDGLYWNDTPVWHPDIDLNPSNTLISVGGAMALTGSILLILSAWQKFRHLSLMSNLSNIVVSLMNFALAIFGTIFFAKYKGSEESPTFWTWVCGSKVDDPLVQFNMLCSETKFSYGMAYAVGALELLVLMNVAVGWVMLGKNGGKDEAARRVVEEIKKAEKAKGHWRGGY
ncbi:hypothetical protein DFH27DRAFT_613704 [Peziza echinospora]|nr:hypothetical protein DFH27DRAFT_613704 [Peziza echinospora]